MNTFVILLAASMGFAASAKHAKLKSPEELRALCDHMQSEANRVIAPMPSSSCGSFLSGSLKASREELKKEFEGNQGVVHYCRELESKLQQLRKYRSGVMAKCQNSGITAAKASANTKSKAQDKLVGDAADARTQIAGQQAGCAGELAPILPESSPDYNIQAAVVPEPKATNAPKDTYPKLAKDVFQRQSQFIENTAKNGGAAAYHEEKDACGATAREYLQLAKTTREQFDQMSDLVDREKDRGVSELESYRSAAAKFSGNGAALKKTAAQLGAEIKVKPGHSQSDD